MTTQQEEYDQSVAVREANPDYILRQSEADFVVTVACWQVQLFDRGLYSGPADGIWGPNSRRAVQLQVHPYGYNGPYDGVWGINTWKGIQQMVTSTSTYRGPIDGVPGPNTWAALFFAYVPLD